MSIAQKYPTIKDLQQKAKKRLPHVSHAYLETGTGDERAATRNLERMAAVTLVPELLKGEWTPDISTTLFGYEYTALFGIRVGMSSHEWTKYYIFELPKMLKEAEQSPFVEGTLYLARAEDFPEVRSNGFFDLSDKGFQIEDYQCFEASIVVLYNEVEEHRQFISNKKSRFC